MRALSGLAAVASILAVSVLGPVVPSDAAIDASTYGTSLAVDVGAAGAGVLPVSVTMPAPGNGVRVAQVTFSWRQTTVTWDRIYTYRITIPTPHCQPDQSCLLETELPTGRMMGGNISVIVSDGVSVLGSTSRAEAVDEPRPTVAMTAPSNHSTAWGTTTLAADAARSTAEVPLKGVRFYLNADGTEDQPYLFDDTAPYAVRVPATDIAAATRTGSVYAVAEDVDGHLSAYDPTKANMRTIAVGPPAELRWTSPPGDGRPAGSLAGGALLAWHTWLPDTAPADSDAPLANPYIDRVEVSIDGVSFATMDADANPIWADFRPDPRYRDASYSHLWNTDSGLTVGAHTATLRVTTSYGSVATLARRFVVTDGVRFGPLTVDGSPLRDDQVFTGGTTHRLRFEVNGTVSGSTLASYELNFDDGAIVDGWNCSRPDWWHCPGEAVAEGDLTLPSTPGTYPLEYSAADSEQVGPDRHRVKIVVQAAARMRIATSASQVRRGRRVVITGRFVRADTGGGRAGIPVTLQWRRAGSSDWVTLDSRETGPGGWVTRRLAAQRTGVYRYRAAGRPGVIAGALSRAVTIHVTR